MKLSDLLFLEAEPLWIKATQKDFLVEMANGTLDNIRYRNYMLQDYIYLKDYIEILNQISTFAQDMPLKNFLKRITAETKKELCRVHIPEMKKIGISGSDIENCMPNQVVTDYVNYFHQNIDGVQSGLTALLQCSWNYAYIARVISEKYSRELSQSAYKSWFDAYTCTEYVKANQLWINILDQYTLGIRFEETNKLCRIFKDCACFENMFWDCLYER